MRHRAPADEMKAFEDDETNRDPMTTASCSTDKENMEPHSQISQH
jgi:hypothetical protein